MNIIGGILSIFPEWLRLQYQEIYEEHGDYVITRKDVAHLAYKFALGLGVLVLFTKLV